MSNSGAFGSCSPEGWGLDTTRQCLAFIKHNFQNTTFKIDSELWDVLLRIDRTIFGDEVFKLFHADSLPSECFERVLDGESRFLFDIILLSLLDLRKGCSFLNINARYGYINYVAMLMLGPNCANIGMESREVFFTSYSGVSARIQQMQPRLFTFQGSPPRFYQKVWVDPLIGVFDRVLYSGILLSQNSGEILKKLKSVVAPGGLLVSGFAHNRLSGFVVLRRNESGEWARPVLHDINTALFDDCFEPVIDFDTCHENHESALLTHAYKSGLNYEVKSLKIQSFERIAATIDLVRRLRNMEAVIAWPSSMLHPRHNCTLPLMAHEHDAKVTAALTKFWVSVRDRFNRLLELIITVEKYDNETRRPCLCFTGFEIKQPPKLPRIWSDWLKVLILFGASEDLSEQTNVFLMEIDRIGKQIDAIFTMEPPLLFQVPPCFELRFECTLPLARFLGDAYVVARITDSVRSLATLSSSASVETISTIAKDLRETIRSVPNRLKTGDLRFPSQLVFFQKQIQLAVRTLDIWLRRVLDEVSIQNDLKNLRLLLCHLNKWLQPSYFLIDNDYFFSCEHAGEAVDCEILVKQLNIRLGPLPAPITDIQSVIQYMARALKEDLHHFLWTMSSRTFEFRLSCLENNKHSFQTAVLGISQM